MVKLSPVRFFLTCRQRIRELWKLGRGTETNTERGWVAARTAVADCSGVTRLL